MRHQYVLKQSWPALTESHHAVWYAVLLCCGGGPDAINKKGDGEGEIAKESGNSGLKTFLPQSCTYTKAPCLYTIHNQMKAVRSHLCCARAANCAPIAEMGHQQEGEREKTEQRRGVYLQMDCETQTEEGRCGHKEEQTAETGTLYNWKFINSFNSHSALAESMSLCAASFLLSGSSALGENDRYRL